MNMKKIFGLLIFFALALNVKAGVLVLEGTYQLRNIFVLNPVSESGVGNCIYEVTVNDDIAPDDLSPNAFEIDLGVYGLKMGEKVIIKIKYREGCEPKVLNPGALKPSATFEITEIKVDKNGLLAWTTINEQGELPFIIQQKKWNKWVDIGEVKGEGTSNPNSYQFKVAPISGKNEVRIIQKSFDGKVRKSLPVSFESNIQPITFTYDKKEQALKFSGKTNYEIYNEYGEIVKRAHSEMADVSSLKKGTHYVTFDNTSGEFDKK